MLRWRLGVGTENVYAAAVGLHFEVFIRTAIAEAADTKSSNPIHLTSIHRNQNGGVYFFPTSRQKGGE